MTRSRRSLLATSAGLALAGCLGLSGSGETSNPPAGTEETPGEPLEFSFGEGAVFTNDEGLQIAVRMLNPLLRETVPVVRDGAVIVDSPEETRYFLFVTVEVANEGEIAFKPPGGLSFRTDGRAVDRTFIQTPGQKYRDIGNLAPGESATGTIAFQAPEDFETGAVSLRFRTLVESPPARWTFGTDDVPTHTTDLSADGLGETITVGKDAFAYAFTPTSVRTTTAYTDDDGREHTAPDGSQFVLLDVRAENVGEEPVKLPTPYDVRLEADGTVHRRGQYEGGGGYPGRVELTPPGGALEGVLLYEVPSSASSFTIRLAVGNETFAEWPVRTETA